MIDICAPTPSVDTMAAAVGAPRERLTQERVLRVALEFTDAHGLAALSMQKLGAELGVKGMSLYTHVDSKDALLDGIVEVMSQQRPGAQQVAAADGGHRDRAGHRQQAARPPLEQQQLELAPGMSRDRGRGIRGARPLTA